MTCLPTEEDLISGGKIPPPGLEFCAIGTDVPRVVPARSDRPWMDGTPDRFAYRCTPLSIANASGWEILCPAAFTARWEGDVGFSGVSIQWDEVAAPYFAVSHFGAGVLTFHTGYLLRTPPGWAVWVRGAPNSAKGRLVPLDGLVETDWLPLPFTMNWRFIEPGEVRFEEGEPFCFVTLFPHGQIDAVQPRFSRLEDQPDLKQHYDEWTASRLAFNAGLALGDEEVLARGWQKRYMRGESPCGRPPPFHRHKRRLAELKSPG